MRPKWPTVHRIIDAEYDLEVKFIEWSDIAFFIISQKMDMCSWWSQIFIQFQKNKSYPLWIVELWVVGSQLIWGGGGGEEGML